MEPSADVFSNYEYGKLLDADIIQYLARIDLRIKSSRVPFPIYVRANPDVPELMRK
jgi:hypothetical protein